jgi:apolipoprotein N-acyltransferase
VSMDSQQVLTAQRPDAQPLETEAVIMRPPWPQIPLVKLLLPGLASAVLLWLCYFPANCGWLAWLALVPFLVLVRSPARPRRVYAATWLGSLAFYLASLQWVRVADWRMYGTWIGLSIWCSFYSLAALYLLRRLDRRTSLPLLTTVPMVWTALEFLRAYLLTGFAWYYLGHTQHNFLPLIQISDLGGAYAVTFLLAAVNALLFEVAYSRLLFRKLFALPDEVPCRGRNSWLLQAAAVAALLIASLGYGCWRLGQDQFTTGPVVALLQGSLDQRLRNFASSPEGTQESIKKVQRHYGDLASEASLAHPDLIVWPETSFLYRWEEVSPGLPPSQVPDPWKAADRERRRTAQTAAEIWKTNLLLGLNAEVLAADARERRYNSAVMIQPGGVVAGRYDKIHCVPFGEYVPLRHWLPWMNKFAPYDFDYSITPGEQLTRFPLGTYHYGVIICYEDTDPCLARQYARSDGTQPAADFLINISNDGWFDGTSEHEEHLAICRFRAIECRRAVARAVNMGISAVIDGNGRITLLPGPSWAASKKVEKVLTAAIPIDRRASLYARWGDWFAWTCSLGLVAGLIPSVRRSGRPTLGTPVT